MITCLIFDANEAGSLSDCSRGWQDVSCYNQDNDDNDDNYVAVFLGCYTVWSAVTSTWPSLCKLSPARAGRNIIAMKTMVTVMMVMIMTMMVTTMMVIMSPWPSVCPTPTRPSAGRASIAVVTTTTRHQR